MNNIYQVMSKKVQTYNILKSVKKVGRLYVTKQSFLKGTLTLIFAGMVTRFLGFLNRIVLARIIGDEGIGLYMMALPTLFLMITLSQIGLPIAVAKLVAEAQMKNDVRKIKQIVILSLLIISCTSIFVMGIMAFTLPAITTHLLTDNRTFIPLLTICPIIPIIGIASIIKGYFQGMHNMRPQSNAIIIEQILRLATVYFFIQLTLPFGIEYAAAGALCSVIIGEVGSLIYLIFIWKKQKQFSLFAKNEHILKNSKQTSKDIFAIALPNSGSRWVSSIANFFEPIAVVQALKIAGVQAIETTKQYGMLTGYALPILFLPTFITNALSIAIVPSIASIDQTNNMEAVHLRLQQTIRLSFISGAFATVIFTCFSSPILTHMYGSSNAKPFIILMAPFFLFLYIQTPIHSALFALNLARQAMNNSIIGVCVKFVVLFCLATNASIGIYGLALAICITVTTITLLHLRVLYKFIHFRLNQIDVYKLIILLCSFFLITNGLKHAFIEEHIGVIELILWIGLLLIIYIILVLLLRLVKKDEWKQFRIRKGD